MFSITVSAVLGKGSDIHSELIMSRVLYMMLLTSGRKVLTLPHL